jgi:hypothetical protein
VIGVLNIGFCLSSVYNNLLFGLFVRIVLCVSFSIYINLCASAYYVKHMLEWRNLY